MSLVPKAVRYEQRHSFSVCFLIAILVVPLLASSSCARAPSQTTAQSEPTPESSLPKSPTSVVDDRSSCANDTRDSLQKRIFSQIGALNRKAFDEARELASPSFKQNVGPSEFQSMIQSGFPFLLTGEPAAFGRCRIVGDTATVEVRFGQNSQTTLVYFLIWWDDQWWIDGASPAVDSLTDKVESS